MVSENQIFNDGDFCNCQDKCDEPFNLNKERSVLRKDCHLQHLSSKSLISIPIFAINPSKLRPFSHNEQLYYKIAIFLKYNCLNQM